MKKGTYDYPHACIPKADDSSPSIDESSVSISINICSQEKTLLLKVHCKKTRNRHKNHTFFQVTTQTRTVFQL